MGTDHIKISTGLDARATKPVLTIFRAESLERETGIEPA
jgi:hypothetical protein